MERTSLLLLLYLGLGLQQFGPGGRAGRAPPPFADAKVTPNGALVWDGNGWIALWDDDQAPRPPPPKTDSWRDPGATLYVGVSSFRDHRCPQTLYNYFTKAKHPERITVGVVQQNDRDDVDCVKEYCNKMGGFKEGPECPFFDNIKTLRVEAKWAAGPCYGRHLQVRERGVRGLASRV